MSYPNNTYEMLNAGTPGSHLGGGDIRPVSEASRYEDDYNESHPAPPRSSGRASSGENEYDPMMMDPPTSPLPGVSRRGGAGTPLSGGRDSMFVADDTQRRFFGPSPVDDGNGVNMRDSFRLGSGSSTPMAEYHGSFAAAGSASAVASHPSDVGSVPLMGGNDTDHDSASPFKFTDKEASSTFDAGAASKQRKRDRILNSYAGGGSVVEKTKRRRMILLGALAGLIIVALAIALPVALTANKKPSNRSTSGNGGGSGGGSGGGDGGGGDGGPGQGAPPANSPTTGGNGSTVITDKNKTFTYNNPYGGFWVSDPNDPFNMNAQAQSCVCFFPSPFTLTAPRVLSSFCYLLMVTNFKPCYRWVPPLNQSWDWAKNRVFGYALIVVYSASHRQLNCFFVIAATQCEPRWLARP